MPLQEIRATRPSSLAIQSLEFTHEAVRERLGGSLCLGLRIDAKDGFGVGLAQVDPPFRQIDL